MSRVLALGLRDADVRVLALIAADPSVGLDLQIAALAQIVFASRGLLLSLESCGDDVTDALRTLTSVRLPPPRDDSIVFRESLLYTWEHLERLCVCDPARWLPGAGVPEPLPTAAAGQLGLAL